MSSCSNSSDIKTNDLTESKGDLSPMNDMFSNISLGFLTRQKRDNSSIIKANVLTDSKI